MACCKLIRKRLQGFFSLWKLPKEEEFFALHPLPEHILEVDLSSSLDGLTDSMIGQNYPAGATFPGRDAKNLPDKKWTIGPSWQMSAIKWRWLMLANFTEPPVSVNVSQTKSCILKLPNHPIIWLTLARPHKFIELDVILGTFQLWKGI